MNRAKLETAAINMVKNILAENSGSSINNQDKEILYSICSQAVLLGYQTANQELLLFISKNNDEINALVKTQ